MAIRKVPFIEGEYYHVYNRGNSKQKIFHDDQDYQRFMALLYACNQDDHFKIFNVLPDETLYDIKISTPLIAIGCYSLMPNHFHLLITPIGNGNVSKFMQKVITAYVMYYNKKYKRTGGLFEGHFKAQHITNDTHLQYLFAYIHLNILKLFDSSWKEKGVKNIEEAVIYLKQYRYSSLIDYLEIYRVENKIIKRDFFPDYFPTKEKMWKELFNWISFS
jgi:REP element-mobilizing transposase RayT